MIEQGEQRMLIDGELVLADSGKTFDNVNPATEEVLGAVADASVTEMRRAIDAARRPFGGYKHSGIGRQNGTFGLEQYLEVKALAWPKD